MISVAFLSVAMVLAEASQAPFADSLGRPVSWDAYGAYPLSTDSILTTYSAKIVDDVLDGELGRAEALSRHRLKVDKEDLVPAWVLAQVVRVHKMVMAEYKVNVASVISKPVSAPTLLYRFYICRMAFLDYLASHRADENLYNELHRNLENLRVQCQGIASRRPAFAISLTNSVPFWTLYDRSVLESFILKHPKGPDLRPLLCRAYLNGVASDVPGEQWPDSPNPKKALETAQALLKDRPSDPFGLYYVGRSSFELRHTDVALRYIKAALNTGKLPPIFQRTAQTFVQQPSSRAFHRIKSVG